VVCDIFGLELNVGDKVIYPEGNFMEYGIIKSFYGNKSNHLEISIPSGDTRVKRGTNVINYNAA
jgi:hypothetical protein